MCFVLGFCGVCVFVVDDNVISFFEGEGNFVVVNGESFFWVCSVFFVFDVV